MPPLLPEGPWLPYLVLLVVALGVLTGVALASLPGSLGLHALAATAPLVAAVLLTPRPPPRLAATRAP